MTLWKRQTTIYLKTSIITTISVSHFNISHISLLLHICYLIGNSGKEKGINRREVKNIPNGGNSHICRHNKTMVRWGQIYKYCHIFFYQNVIIELYKTRCVELSHMANMTTYCIDLFFLLFLVFLATNCQPKVLRKDGGQTALHS